MKRSPTPSQPDTARSTGGTGREPDAACAAKGATHRRRKVVVVAREGVYTRKVHRALEANGHRVGLLHNPASALERFPEHRPELLIVDLDLEDRAGEALFRSVRRAPASEHLPTLFLARGGVPLELMRGVPLEAACVLKKPFTAQQFLHFVAPMLERLDLIDRCGVEMRFEAAFATLDLHDLLGLLEAYARTGLLEVRGPRSGEVAMACFERGRLIAAELNRLPCAELLTELSLWTEGSFRFQGFEKLGAPPSRNISGEQWEEQRALLHLLDSSRLNPFPRARSGGRSEDESLILPLKDALPRSAEEELLELALSDALPRSAEEELLELALSDALPRSNEEELLELVLCDVLPRSAEDEPLELSVRDALSGIPTEPLESTETRPTGAGDTSKPASEHNRSPVLHFGSDATLDLLPEDMLRRS